MDEKNEKIEKKEYRMFIDINSFMKKIGKPINILCLKTKFCKHHEGCLNNIISGSLQSFLLGYSIKSIINLIGLLMSFKKLKKK